MFIKEYIKINEKKILWKRPLNVTRFFIDGVVLGTTDNTYILLTDLRVVNGVYIKFRPNNYNGSINSYKVKTNEKDVDYVSEDKRTTQSMEQSVAFGKTIEI